MTVHLGSRDAANDTSLVEMMPAMQSAAGNNHLQAAAFMHRKFAKLFSEYGAARHLQSAKTPWFTVALPDQ